MMPNAQRREGCINTLKKALAWTGSLAFVPRDCGDDVLLPLQRAQRASPAEPRADVGDGLRGRLERFRAVVDRLQALRNSGASRPNSSIHSNPWRDAKDLNFSAPLGMQTPLRSQTLLGDDRLGSKLAHDLIDTTTITLGKRSGALQRFSIDVDGDGNHASTVATPSQ